jgi:acyl-CoA dehydrogenase
MSSHWTTVSAAQSGVVDFLATRGNSRAMPLPTTSPFYSDEHREFRAVLDRFVAKEITPFVHEWDEAEEFPVALYEKAAAVGILGAGFPEEYGGIGTDAFLRVIIHQALAQAGSGGVSAGVISSYISMPVVLHHGTEAQRQMVLPEVLSGKKISALAITEPSGGSDVANLQATAKREGDEFVINGAKTFITSGMRADWFTVGVRTGNPGRTGLSVLLVAGNAPGLSRTPLKKMGWWSSDTATLYFDDCRVPAANLIGEENGGWPLIMGNFTFERLDLIAQSLAFSQVCIDESIAYAKERITFGKPLISNQAIRHKIVDMSRKVNSCQAWMELLAWRLNQGENPAGDVAQCKVEATTTFEYCAREAVQIFGGAGYLRGATVERLYREVRVQAIGGGSEEVMRDLAAKQMGL